MAKVNQPIQDIVESHKPKNFKYYYDFHNDETLIELERANTICQRWIQFKIRN